MSYILWTQAGPTWPYFLPNKGGSFLIVAPDIEIGAPAVTIGSATDLSTALLEARLSIFLVAFSILMLQPVLEAIWPESVPPKTPRIFLWLLTQLQRLHKKRREDSNKVP